MVLNSLKRLLLLAVLLVSGLAACSSTSPTPTAAPAAPQNGSPIAVATPLPTVVPTTTALGPNSVSPDWTKLGFGTVAVTQDIAAGAGATIQSGPYTIQVPAGAFTDAVRVQLLTGDPAHFNKGPAAETPVLAFALNILDAKTNRLL